MKDHLTQQDMIRYVDIFDITPENMMFIGEIHTHVFQCEECQLKLDAFCMQAETTMAQSKVSFDSEMDCSR